MVRPQLDPSIISRAVGPSVPLKDLGQTYSEMQQIRQGQIQMQGVEEAQRQKQLQNDAYANATGPDGVVDQNKLVNYLAQNQGGSAIPGVQKNAMDLNKTRAEIADKQSGTDKNNQEMLHNSLKLVDNTIASLAARPDTNEQMVYGEMGRLVNAGAFKIQAKQAGVSEDTYAKQLLGNMPVGNPQGLKSWLIQQGARIADATKRLEMSLPKYDEQNRGNVINEGTVDQMTGQRTPGRNVALSADPNAVLSATTSRRNADLVNDRAVDANTIAKEAAATQLVETPQGYQAVNKGTAVARPVMVNGQPVLGKDSTVAKNAQMADRLTQMIPAAKELLRNATASGAGALADKALNFIGTSSKSTDAATALETLSGWMTSNVPRFEGPQSDKDTETYKIMAGMVGDRTKPESTRLAALDAMEQLMGQYRGDRVAPYAGPPGTAPATEIAPRPLLPQGDAVPPPPQYRRSSDAAPGAPARRPSLDSMWKN